MKFLLRLSKIVFILLLIALSLGIYVWRIEPRWVVWNYLDMPIKNLPDSLIGKRIIHLSDIHLGDQVEEKYIIDKFSEVNSINPHIVVYTGDFISLVADNQAPYKQLKSVFQQAAKGQLKTMAVLGNHDYGDVGNGLRADSVAHILKSNGINVLRNDSLHVHGLCIIGIDDYSGSNFSPAGAMQKYNPHHANLVLVHNPDVCDLDVWNGYDGWILAGHTHGGQVRLPFQKAKVLPVENKHYDEGLKDLPDGRMLYINRGLGHSHRIRWNVRPEITVFTLKKERVEK